MRTPLLALVALLALSFSAQAQDIAGTWQADGKPQRVLKIRKDAKGYRGEFYYLGDEIPGQPLGSNGISSLSVVDGTIKFSLDKTGATFNGKLESKNITGTWKTTYGQPQPLTFARAAKGSEWMVDPSPHKDHFFTVQPGVKLEVLDWGGSGPPLIFLAGLTGTAHSFDSFAPKFTARHHVYGITRRGFGASDAPPITNENYDADRLGDDVLAVMDALKIDHPVLAGHSIAGEELSSVGTRHPEKIGGLIYLDALYGYSFYNPAQEDHSVDSATVRRDLDQLFELQFSPAGTRALIAEILATLPKLQTGLQQMSADYEGMPETPHVQTIEDLAGNRIFTNTRRYGVARTPILAILARPRRCQPNCEKPFMQKLMAAEAALAEFFEKSNPSAHVVRIAGASHFIWRSNEADVLREMNAFLDRLPH
jgi:pimeloyl-ACP methyl ester carboxylesterase